MARSTFGHIQRIDKTHYRVFWHSDGKRHSKRCGSREEASNFLAKIKLQQGKVNYSVTYEEYYESAIKPTYKHLAERTAHDYKRQWKKVRPLIGDCKIADTNWRFVQNMIDQFSTNSSQKLAYKLVCKILNMAVKDELIPANPCTVGMNFVKPKKVKKHLYTKEELIDVLTRTNGTEFAIPVLLECMCGLRHEELCGLTLSDFSKGADGWVYIKIQRALTEVNGRRVMKETKNEHSERVVLLHPKFVDYFESNINFMTEKEYIDDFTAPNVYRHKWVRYCKDNELRYVPFGHMRSVYATLCAEAGCLDSLVAKSMGHVGRSIKERNYQTSTIKALKINAEMFAEYMVVADQSLRDVHRMYTTFRVPHRFSERRKLVSTC